MNSSILKSLLLLIFLILCTTLCAQTFYESFDGCEGVGGNDGYWNKSTVAGNVVTDNSGWKFDGASVQGNKCARLGSSSSSGYAVTPALGIDGDATLTFRAGPWTGWAKELEISITGGDGKVSTKNLNMVEETFTDFTIELYGLSTSAKVRIASPAKQGRFFLDEVKVVPKNPALPSVTLDGDITDDNNTTVISENVGKTLNVKVARTLKADGGWYTLCLPFDVVADDITTVLGGAKVETMSSLRINESGTEITFAKAESVEAGTPFIICPITDIADVVFTEKTIATESPRCVSLTNANGTFSFRGIFSATSLKSDGSERFLSSDGRNLTKPKGDSQLKALRAYFELPAESEVTISTSENTAIVLPVSTSADDNLLFDLQGRRLADVPQRGIYIHNGKKIANH
ncbi:MAG: hypothetical protein IJL45_06620 [Prevotella sp.]|nr:hypothetical protein [Prevotella sp.]